VRWRLAFFAGSLGAPSIRLVARSGFLRMADGTFSSPHSGPCRAASIVQRGVVVELAGDVVVDVASQRGSARVSL
jgi:hypothetical protein